MKEELSKSNLTDDEILAKTRIVMKAFGKGDEKGASLLDLSLASKQTNSALKQAGISPKDFAKVRRQDDGKTFSESALQSGILGRFSSTNSWSPDHKHAHLRKRSFSQSSSPPPPFFLSLLLEQTSSCEV